jgi:hypothetical protein
MRVLIPDLCRVKAGPRLGRPFAIGRSRILNALSGQVTGLEAMSTDSPIRRLRSVLSRHFRAMSHGRGHCLVGPARKGVSAQIPGGRMEEPVGTPVGPPGDKARSQTVVRSAGDQFLGHGPQRRRVGVALTPAPLLLE